VETFVVLALAFWIQMIGAAAKKITANGRRGIGSVQKTARLNGTKKRRHYPNI